MEVTLYATISFMEMAVYFLNFLQLLYGHFCVTKLYTRTCALKTEKTTDMSTTIMDLSIGGVMVET